MSPANGPGTIAKALLGALVAAFFFVAVEGAARLLSESPSGKFAFLLPRHQRGLYPPGATILNTWGRVDYTVETNSLGLRGPELSDHEPLPGGRVACVGDSITDGFFVDNRATYPYQLGELLRDAGVEVFSAARGGGTIDKQLAILREVALPLRPDVVVLTFVTNDISGLRKMRDGRDVLSGTTGFANEQRPFRERAFTWLVNRTAIGEIAYGLLLDARFGRSSAPGDRSGEARYEIANGSDFAANTALFLEKNRDTDGIVLRESLPEEAEALLAVYLEGLDAFVRGSREAGARPMLAYFPAYPQIYDPDVPLTIRDRLRHEAESRNVPFCDLTPVFRAAGRDRPLHLAPLDFHLNPEGNRVLAGGIGDCLRRHDLVGPPAG